MSRSIVRQAAVLGLAALMLIVACGGPDLPPPDGPPAATDGHDGEASPNRPPDTDTTSDAARDLLEPHAQPLLPGLYLPEGVLVSGTDHYAFVLTQLGCDELAAIIDSGQWQVEDRVAWPLPTPNPAEGIPELPSTDWLLLRSGTENAIARIGGDEDGCAAQVWRISHQPVAASGAVEAAADVPAVQLFCGTAGGGAGFAMTYIGPGDVRFSIESEVPLEIGTHPLSPHTEVLVGRSDIGQFELFQAFADPDGAAMDESAFDAWFPADGDADNWGSVTVTSVEPLVGEMSFKNLADERGRRLSLTAGFRCDLPVGQLARAAEMPRETATPDTEPTPAPAGRLVMTIASGPHAGTHEIESTNISCSYNLLGGDSWNAGYYSDDEPRTGELQTVNVSMPTGGGSASVLATLGDDFDADWFNDNDASGELEDRGDVVEFFVSGTAANGVGYEIAITCTDVGRF